MLIMPKSPSSSLYFIVAAVRKALRRASKSQQKKFLLGILQALQKWKQIASDIFLLCNAEDLCLQLKGNSSL